MTTYAWTEHHMSVRPLEDGLENVVKRIQAVYTATDGAKTCSQLLVVTLDPPDPENFTPYADLTLTQVIGWIEDKVSTAFWQGALDERLVQMDDVDLPCPWD